MSRRLDKRPRPYESKELYNEGIVLPKRSLRLQKRHFGDVEEPIPQDLDTKTRQYRQLMVIEAYGPDIPPGPPSAIPFAIYDLLIFVSLVPDRHDEIINVRL